jgi:hypothetical protein
MVKKSAVVFVDFTLTTRQILAREPDNGFETKKKRRLRNYFHTTLIL